MHKTTLQTCIVLVMDSLTMELASKCSIREPHTYGAMILLHRFYLGNNGRGLDQRGKHLALASSIPCSIPEIDVDVTCVRNQVTSLMGTLGTSCCLVNII